MNYYDEELEGRAKSIEDNLTKFSKIKNYSIVGFAIGFIVMLYLLIRYPGQENPPLSNTTILLLIFLISYIEFINATTRLSRLFEDMRGKIFFYLFYSWKYHSDEKGKKYLKICVDELSSYLDAYKELAYTEDIYSTFDALRDTLTYHIYPQLGVRGAPEKPSDLAEQTSAWNEFKSLCIDFYQNVPMESINEKISNLKGFFARDETVKLDNENKLINIGRVFINWNFEMYTNSLFYRFIFFIFITGFVDYLLISKNIVNIDVLLPETIVIPILAPHYLAPKSK